MRSDAREAAFKVIFADLFHEDDGDLRRSVYCQDHLSEEDVAFADALIDCVDMHREELLSIIAERATRYPDYRIFAADRAIMLVALAEIKYFNDIPPVVSVSEATNLARKYSSANSTDFVNGLLGGIINA